jgi:peptidoglycan DL-endopeptidase CwlO
MARSRLRPPTPLRLVALLLAGFTGAVGLAARPAAAEPGSLATTRAQVHALQAQLERLGIRENQAVEAYNGARYRLTLVQTRVTQNARALARARIEQRLAQRKLAARLVAIYREPPPSLVVVLLTSPSLSTVTARDGLFRRVEGQDQAMVSRLTALRAQIATARRELLVDRRRARGEAARAMAERHRIASVLGQRRAFLASRQRELAVLVAQERRRQEALAVAARARVARELERERQVAAAPAAADVAPAPDPPTPIITPPAVTPAPPAPPASSGGRPDVVAYSMQFLGIPYRWGGADPSTGFDCSGLTQYVYARFGISMVHYTGSQYSTFPKVARDQLQPGDLVFFHNLGHEGMYIGNDHFIHAPHTGDVVKISSLNDPSYVRGWVGAVRPY